MATRKSGKKGEGRAAPRKPTDLGGNRTGAQAAPLRTKAMEEGPGSLRGDPLESSALAVARAEHSREAPPIGTMPVPGTMRGVAKTIGKALQGEKASVLLDKLGERLAFERTGVRLYEAVLAKMPAARLTKGTLSVEDVRRFRDAELAHAHLVKGAIEELGGDPTAVTPSGDLAGVQGQGLVQTVTDPRTTLTQCLDALLTAELADNDGWKMLIALAEAAGLEELARRFTEALAEEDRHLSSMRGWIAERLGIQLGKKLPSTEFGEPARTD